MSNEIVFWKILASRLWVKRQEKTWVYIPLTLPYLSFHFLMTVQTADVCWRAPYEVAGC